MKHHRTSELSKFYDKPLVERQKIVSSWADLDEENLRALQDGGLSLPEADLIIENVIGSYTLPLGVATNFLINGRDYLIPMVIEEPSVVAACSYAAKLFRAGGGFVTSSDRPEMIGQIQLLDLTDLQEASSKIESCRIEVLELANEVAGSIVERGGGAIDLETRAFPDCEIGKMLVVHLHFDTRDAMGANVINTVLEHIAPFVESISGGRANLRILSNLSDRRKARAEGVIRETSLSTNDSSGEKVIDAIIEAAVFAEVDPYRAVTHNKGIMNGIDALMIATGNDWRAVEAGAHAYAARDGRYKSLTKWWKDERGNLRGSIEVPMAVGIVGGATRVQGVAKASLKILGVRSACELAEVAAAVGLAQNLAAIRALATNGIQKGHMRLHARQLALAAGSETDKVSQIAETMIDEGNIRLERAKELVSGKGQGA